MKNLKLLLISSLVFFLSAAHSSEMCTSVQVPAAELLNTLKAVSEGLYKDISFLKVNLDGDGKLSVFYENGEPKLLKLTYTNSKGTIVVQKSFDELERGIPLVYENKDKPGKAIVLEKTTGFKDGDKYSFKLSIRSGVDPEKHAAHQIDFESDPSGPKLLSNKKPFKNIVLSPGVSMFSWDGTFKKVEFKN
jgi:hypothetical protein